MTNSPNPGPAPALEVEVVEKSENLLPLAAEPKLALDLLLRARAGVAVAPGPTEFESADELIEVVEIRRLPFPIKLLRSAPLEATEVFPAATEWRLFPKFLNDEVEGTGLAVAPPGEATSL